MQLLPYITNIKGKSDVNENWVRAVILFEFCNLNYPMNNWMHCLFLFWNWKCIFITSPWVSIAKDGVILVQFFCSWSSADLELLSPVSTAVSSAEHLALHLCVQTHQLGVCVTEPVSSCKISIDRPRFPPQLIKYLFWPRGREEKTLELCAFSALCTHSGSLLVTGPVHRTVHRCHFHLQRHLLTPGDSPKLPPPWKGFATTFTRGCNRSWQNFKL